MIMCDTQIPNIIFHIYTKMDSPLTIVPRAPSPQPFPFPPRAPPTAPATGEYSFRVDFPYKSQLQSVWHHPRSCWRQQGGFLGTSSQKMGARLCLPLVQTVLNRKYCFKPNKTWQSEQSRGRIGACQLEQKHTYVSCTEAKTRKGSHVLPACGWRVEQQLYCDWNYVWSHVVWKRTIFQSEGQERATSGREKETC